MYKRKDFEKRFHSRVAHGTLKVNTSLLFVVYMNYYLKTIAIGSNKILGLPGPSPVMRICCGHLNVGEGHSLFPHLPEERFERY